jgi:outer membrane biosynthesis protein TonB
MSESPWQSRAPFPPLVRPEALIGAASPLWGYFTGAAVAGMSWWWMTHWMRPNALEAVAERALEPVVDALAEVAGGPVAEALVSDKMPPVPVGGEAAPFGPATLEAALISEPEAKPISEPEAESVPEPKAEAVPEPKAEPVSAPKAEAVPEPKAEAVPEPKAEPVSESKAALVSQPKAEPLSAAKAAADLAKTAAPPPRMRKPRDGEPKPH